MAKALVHNSLKFHGSLLLGLMEAIVSGFFCDTVDFMLTKRWDFTNIPTRRMQGFMAC